MQVPIFQTLQIETQQVQHKLYDTMHIVDSPQKNFGLTIAQFNHLVEQLKLGNNALLTQVVAVHYTDFCRILIKQGANAQESYELFADALIVFHDGLISGKFGYNNLKSMFTQIGKFILRGRQRRSKKEDKSIEVEDMPFMAEVMNQDWDEPQFEALEKAWALLKPDCQSRLQQFHIEGLRVREIAESQDMTLNAMLVALKRCRDYFRMTFFKYYSY